MIIDVNNLRDLQILSHAETHHKVIGLTSGCFDMLHTMHLLYLERCRRQCDFLIVGVDSDATVQRHKNRIPVIHEQERTELISALRCVDAAFVLADAVQDFPRIVQRFRRPREVKIFKHSDLIYGAGLVLSEQCVIVPDVIPTMSSTELKRRVSAFSDRIDDATKVTPAHQKKGNAKRRRGTRGRK